MSLEFSYSNWFLLLVLICATALAYWLYASIQKKHDVKPLVKYTLMGLRFTALLGLLLLLLNPLIKIESITKQKPIIALGIDNSASIASLKDSIAYKQQILNQIDAIKNKLEQKFDLKVYTFGAQSQTGQNITFKEKQTNPSTYFEQIESNYANNNIVAAIVMTDGIINEGNIPDIVADKMKHEIYGIALGDTSSRKDALIDQVNHNKIAYLGNLFPIDINIKSTDLIGKNAKLKILHKGNVIKEKIIQYTQFKNTITEKFVLDAKESGVQTYQIQLEKLNEEISGNNNFASFSIEVIDAKEKILILAQSPHPDIAAIKQSLESNENYEVNYFEIDKFKGNLNAYSLVILHQLNQSTINPIIQNCNALFYIGATSLLQINDLKLPASMKLTETEANYNKGFALFSLSEQSSAIISNAPAVMGLIGDYGNSQSFQSLFYQKIGVVETQTPLLAFSNLNNKKIAWFMGDGLWKWRLYNYQNHQNFDAFNELIKKCVQYLATKEDKSFFRLNLNKNIKENDAVMMEAEVYDNTYALTGDAEVSLDLKNENNKVFQYSFTKNQNAFSLNAGTFPPGSYSYIATAKYKGQTYKKTGNLYISPLISETANLTANHDWLYNICKKSGGEMFSLDKANILIEKLLANNAYKTIQYSQKKLTEIINIKWLLGILLMLFTAEWVIRKRNGLI
jgi:hypothetical protein